MISLGPWPEVSAAAARRRAAELRDRVRDGQNPAADRRATRQQEARAAAGETVSALLAEWQAAHVAEWSASWVREVGRLVRRLPASEVARRVQHVRPEDIERWLEREPGLASRRHLYQALRRAWTWATMAPAWRGLLEGRHPVRAVAAPPRVARRQRVLSDDELRAVVAASEVRAPLRHLVPLLLLTGVRVGEALGATWLEVDGAAALWRIPGARTKSGEPHTVPLSVPALGNLLGAWLRGGPPAGTASYRYATNAITALSAPARVRGPRGVERGERPALWPAGVRLHDLRRTVRQRLTEQGCAPHVAEAILGHVPSGLTRTYSPAWEPVPEMRAALVAWGAQLETIIGG